MKRFISLIAALAFAGAAQAQFYVTATASHLSGSQSHDPASLGIGYAFSKYLSVEAGTMLDKHAMTANDLRGVSRTPLGGNVFRSQTLVTNETLEAPLRVTLRLNAPLTQKVSAFGTLSAYRIKTHRSEELITSDVKENTPPTPSVLLARSSTTATHDVSTTLPAFGLGVRAGLTKEIAFIASVERINLKDGMLRDTDHLRVTNVGVEWRF